MGIYIDPSRTTKEQWYKTHAKPITREEAAAFTDFEGDSLPIVMVINPGFNALGIAYDADELTRFLQPDWRLMYYALALKTDLEPFM